MLVYRGTNWLYQFDINPIEDNLYEIVEFDGTINDVDDSEFGLGLYFKTEIVRFFTSKFRNFSTSDHITSYQIRNL